MNPIPQRRIDKYLIQRNTAREERNYARHERKNLQDGINQMHNNEVLREQFVATLSHDLRSPVGAIKMATEILRKDYNNQDFEEMIDLIDRNADMAEELISRLLDATLIKSGSVFPINPKRCEIFSILKECKENFSPLIQERIICNTNIEDHIAIWGKWDCFALQRVFNNLLSNAVKFSDNNQKITVNIWQKDKKLNVTIHNKGKVISLNDQSKIFDSYYRTDNSDKIKGWGLGLTLVKGIIEAHNGTVDVSSSEQAGTTFTIKIPYCY